MSRFVVDASVAIKWYLPEIHSAQALHLLAQENTLLVPDLLFAEVGNILWKRIRSEELTEDEAGTVLVSLRKLPLTITASHSLVLPALTIACQTQRTVYDGLYLALAVRENAVLVTADAKFVHALQSSPMARYVLPVESMQAS